MPATLAAAAVFVVLLLPGYLFQRGFSDHRILLRPDRDVYAVAQAIGISAVIVCLVSALLSVTGPEEVVTELWDTKLEHGLNQTQAVAILLLVLAPYFVGIVL